MRTASLLVALALAVPAGAVAVHGHRGSRGTRPENTLAAFSEALRVGADVLELDLNVTKDDALVVSHDQFVEPERCLGPKGERLSAPVAIRTLTLKEVKAYDCGTLGNPRFPRQLAVPGERMPTLDEVFELVARSTYPAAARVEFNVETKLAPGRPELSPSPERFAQLVAAAIGKRKLFARVILQSFDYRTLRAMKTLAPEVRLSALTSDNTVDGVALAKELGASFISPDREWITANGVAALHAAGVQVAPWTANDEAQWARLLAMGVDAIITDYPEDLLAYLKRAAPKSARAPALTVVISVDQMRADYLTRFAKDFTGGFARLVRDGAVFTRARHVHVPTETSPGHAALMTGCFPGQHGIVGNEWWDKKEKRGVYAVEDPDYNRSPVNLECPTLGDALKAASPSSRVVSVSGKDRAAILMGGRKPDLALWYDRNAGQFVTSGWYGRMPDWVWNWDDTLRIPADQRDTIYYTPRYDRLALELATKAIEETKLGVRGVPDLLAISLSATDIVGHKFGPDSPQMRENLKALDESLGAFFSELDRRFGPDGYVLALAADHGVTPLPEVSSDPSAVRLVQDDLAKQLDAALAAKFGPAPSGKWVFDMHSPYAYLELASKAGAEPVLAEAQRWLLKQPSVAYVYTPADLAGDAEGPFVDRFRRSYRPGRSGDLMILFKRGVVLAEGPSGTVHGLPYDDDARVPLVFMGAGVKPGRLDQPVLATDLAPTLARLLGVALPPRAPSRVLTEIIPDSAPSKLLP